MKRVLYVFSVLILALLLVAEKSHAEFYGSVYIGGAIPHEADVEDNTGAGGTGKVDFDAGIAAGAKLGHWFSEQNAPYFGLQLDLNGHFPDTDKLTTGGLEATVDADVKVYSASVNALIRYPEGPVRPYAGVGVGWFNAEIDDGTLSLPLLGISTTFSGESDSAFGWQLLAGLDLEVAPNVSLFGEYKYSRADFEFGGSIGLDVEYSVSQVYGGVSYHF